MEDVEAIAKGLTKAQRAVIVAMQPGEFHNSYELCRQRQTRMKLTNSGITEPHVIGPVTEYWRIRLSPLGLAVRTYLLSQTKE